ncbi:hypothetical protein [Confluentibacter flavum]|uniref:hypothetical protein n=1 Tax=Confluentibacter flavum TaxID=1909700 RepID=UPI0012FF3D25|nr:hypothetical protein [Confluentibacter flavum]
MRISINHILLATLLLNFFMSCTPTEIHQKSTPPAEVVATGDDSSVRPDNDKDD